MRLIIVCLIAARSRKRRLGPDPSFLFVRP